MNCSFFAMGDYTESIHLQNVCSKNVYSWNIYFTKHILTQRMLTKRILMQCILSLNVYSTERRLNILYTPGFSLSGVPYTIALKRVLIVRVQLYCTPELGIRYFLTFSLFANPLLQCSYSLSLLCYFSEICNMLFAIRYSLFTICYFLWTV
jgi:hypothetical protein